MPLGAERSMIDKRTTGRIPFLLSPAYNGYQRGDPSYTDITNTLELTCSLHFFKFCIFIPNKYTVKNFVRVPVVETDRIYDRKHTEEGL